MFILLRAISEFLDFSFWKHFFELTTSMWSRSKVNFDLLKKGNVWVIVSTLFLIFYFLHVVLFLFKSKSTFKFESREIQLFGIITLLLLLPLSREKRHFACCW